MAPLEYLLNLTIQQYGIYIILSQDDHPCKQRVRKFIKGATTPAKPATGQRRIADLVLDLIGTGNPLEEATHHQKAPMDALQIGPNSKEDEAPKYKEWARQINKDTIRRYTDGSKGANGTTSSAGHCVRGRQMELIF